MKNAVIVAVLCAALLVACTPSQPATPQGSVPEQSQPGPLQTTPTVPTTTQDAPPLPPQPATAGALSGYIDYDAARYKQATDSGQLVFLEFYAAWCPFCRALDPIIREAFSELQDEKVDVVGFRVDYDTQKDLKKQFGVTYQHTHILLKDGKVVWRALDSGLTKEELKETIVKYAG